MAIVKGSKQHRVKVIEDRPYLRVLVLIGSVFFGCLAVYAAYQKGHIDGASGQQQAETEMQTLRVNLEQAESKAEGLAQQLANTNFGAEVDRQASEEIRQEVISLKEQIAALKEENGFYRGLMAPTKNQRGLTFGAVELGQTERTRTYRYKVVMQQLATNHQLLNGALTYTVIGRKDGLDASYALKELSSQVGADVIKLRFKYFQTIEGELRLPEGFDPVAIELVAKSTGKKPVTVEKRFGWLVEEAI